MRSLSLRKRLLLAAATILMIFLGLAGFVLDRAFINSAEISLRSQLHEQHFALLTVLEVTSRGDFEMPELVPVARLITPYSKLKAYIIVRGQQIAWQSISSLGVDIPSSIFTPATDKTFSRTSSAFYGPFQYSFPISWETEEALVYDFTLVLHEAGEEFAKSIATHRKTIILWLGLVGIFLLLALMLALRWSLAPLQRVRHEIDQVESGRQEGITGQYPAEISELSQRINLFIRNERNNLVRHKNTLEDLAHSLKTPLTVIHGMTESDQPISPKELADYVGQMRNIVNYQLNRAVRSRISLIHNQINVQPLMDQVIRSIGKVYADRHLLLQSTVTPGLTFYGDESDLMELLGNLLDNACKWAKSAVQCKMTLSDDGQPEHCGIRILIEDDGPGIHTADREEVLRRGVRAGKQLDGQGIGLSVCQEIVDAYGGSLIIEDSSSLGGAAVQVILKHPLNH